MACLVNFVSRGTLVNCWSKKCEKTKNLIYDNFFIFKVN